MSLTTEQIEKLVPLLLSYNPEDQNQAQILIETLIDTEKDFREFLKYMNVSPFSSVPTFEELKGCFGHLDNQQQNFYGIWTLSMLAKWNEQVRVQTTMLMIDNLESRIETLWRLPDNIHYLENLQTLHLCHIELEELPESIGELTNLKTLWLALNPLTTLPESICKLTNLVEFNLQYTQLKKLPKNIGKLTQLTSLDLEENPLSYEEWERLEKALPNCKFG